MAGAADAWTYTPGGEDLAAVEPPGLLLPLWFSAAVVVRAAEGEVDEGAVADGAGRSEARDGLSWGAGDGAMAMAALIVDENAIERKEQEVCEALTPKAAGLILALSQGLSFPRPTGAARWQGLGPPL